MPAVERRVTIGEISPATGALELSPRTSEHNRAAPISARWIVGLLTAAFIAAGAAFAAATPLFQSPDEPTHLDMARHYASHPTEGAGPSLRQTQGLRGAIAATGLRDEALPPDFSRIPETRPDYLDFAGYGGDTPATTGCPVSCQNYQYIHPPGWYLLVSPVVAVLHAAPFPDLVRVLRAIDVLLASVAVWATWYIARQVWPDHPRRALFAASLTACFGPLIATAAAVNNDSLMLALMASSLAVMARILRHGTEPRSVLLLGVLIGAGLLTKGEFLVITGVAVLTLLVAPRREALWRTALRFGVPSALGALWWARVVVDTHSLTPAGSEIVRAARSGPWESVSIFSFLRDQPLNSSIDSPVCTDGCLCSCRAGRARCSSSGCSDRSSRGSDCGAGDAHDRPRLGSPCSRSHLCCCSWRRPGRRSPRSGPTVRSGEWPPATSTDRYRFSRAAVAALAAVASRTKWLRSGRVLALSLIVVAFTGVVVSFVEAMRGLYATSSLHEMIHRAGVVAPVSRPTLFVVAAAVMWTIAILATAWLLWTDRVRETASVFDDVGAEPLASG